jgi:hypothetical protein
VVERPIVQLIMMNMTCMLVNPPLDQQTAYFWARSTLVMAFVDFSHPHGMRIQKMLHPLRV